MGDSWKCFFRLSLLVTVLICIIFYPLWTTSHAQEPSEEIKIGVLAKRGKKICLEKWGPTADYLTKKIPGYSFTILPLGYDKISSAVQNEKVDFIFANSSFYVEFELIYNVSRIATLRNLRIGKAYTTYGGVIFCRADREDISNLNDLKGKTFISLDEKAFASWPAVWREIKEQGIDPYSDFADLRFRGPMDEVVYAVRDGSADAGSVRTDLLERMEMEGKISMANFRVLNLQKKLREDFPFVHSTRLYPEWPMAKLFHTSDELAREVAIALISMSPDSPVAKAAKCAGWTVPLNYQPVHECMKILQIGPFKDYGTAKPMAVFLQYWYWLLGIIVLLIIFLVIYITYANRRLKSTLYKQEKDTKEARKEITVYDISGWTVGKKMWLIFGLLIGILTCNGIVSYIMIRQSYKDLENFVNVAEPLQESLLEMEINLDEAARAVFDYALTQKPHDKENIYDAETDFENYAMKFGKLAKSELLKRHEQIISSLYIDFRMLGNNITILKDQQISEVQKFTSLIKEIDSLIGDKLQANIDEASHSALRKKDASIKMEIIIDKVYGSIMGYLATRDPNLIDEIHDAENGFERYEKEYRLSTYISADEESWLTQINVLFHKIVKSGADIMKLNINLHNNLMMFETDLNKIDRLLDENIQPIIHKDLLMAKASAKNTSKTALIIILVLSFIAIAIAIISALLMNKNILVSIARLLTGVRKFGTGELDYKIDVKKQDEFGQLALAFNQMAEKRKLALEELVRHQEHLQDMVNERTKELETAQLQLLSKERLATLGKLTAVVSHELRNPLGTIHSSLFIIKERILGKDLKLDKPLERAERNIKRCNNIIEEMLYYTREREPDLKVTEFDKWLDKMLDEHEIPAGIRLTRKLSAGIEISFDPEQLHRCIINVIDNACEAMKEQSELQANECEGVEDNELIVETGIVDNRLNVRIIDSGPGMSQEKLEKVFEPLYSTKSFGAGLGLSIVKQIIEQHKGGIEIKSKPMKGTVITWWLPIN